MTALLEVDDLQVSIATRDGEVPAVSGLSFSIERGEILGVIGESGAGKSLTGTAILGLLEPPLRQTGGRIFLEGERIDDQDENVLRRLRGRKIAAVFQDPLTSLNPLMTIGYQLIQTMMTHLPLTNSEARDRAARLLAEVGLPAPRERLENYPHELSGGMRQRVVLALAFACEPRVIVADEPTTALDVSVQRQIIELLKRMCRDHGTAVMLITHDMGVISEAADRVAVIYAGRLIEIGATVEILRRPNHPYTRALMAAIPSLKRRSEDLPQIRGSMPRPEALPGGCAFHPRCSHTFDKCHVDRPELLPAEGSSVACWLVSGPAAAISASP
jgi:peptide/nickel transport system ATP-binding protein